MAKFKYKNIYKICMTVWLCEDKWANGVYGNCARKYQWKQS